MLNAIRMAVFGRWSRPLRVQIRTVCRKKLRRAVPRCRSGAVVTIYWGRTLKSLERVKGIEPSYSAWKAAALPLSYTRVRRARSSQSGSAKSMRATRFRRRRALALAGGLRKMGLYAFHGAGRARTRPAISSNPRPDHASVSLPHYHPWPQHGRRARPLARDRHEGRRFRQADHRGRQFLHPVRARPRASEGPRPTGRARDRGRGRRRQGIQHHRGRRRHRDGPRRHALFAALARDHRRQRRIHGQRPLRRRAGVHLELRQDHARHADGGAAPQHPGRLRLRRADGGGQGQAFDRRAQGRPDRRDGRGRG